MKKLFCISTLILLAGTFAHAQVSSEIRDFNNNNIVTDDTITFWVDIGDAHAYNFNQYNIGSSQVTYKVAKSYVQMMSGASANFCVYHNNDAGDPQSQCYIPSIFLSGDFITAPGEYNTLLADFTAGSTSTGTSIVVYKFYDVNSPADSARITLVYNVTPVGIAEGFGNSSLGEPYPNPANGVVHIPVRSTQANAKMIITNALGQQVLVQTVNNLSLITIDVSLWKEGMYFVCLFSEEGDVIARRKLMNE